uniref:Uncharacterized protein n=1 Tax=viral metagenome TaxID=1070528 RepID=A0A6M3JQK3_9ZZZZ
MCYSMTDIVEIPCSESVSRPYGSAFFVMECPFCYKYHDHIDTCPHCGTTVPYRWDHTFGFSIAPTYPQGKKDKHRHSRMLYFDNFNGVWDNVVRESERVGDTI